jgi:hypothetical protein
MLAVWLLVPVADVVVAVAEVLSEVMLALLAVWLLVPVADVVVMVAEVLSEVMLVLVVAVRVTLVLVHNVVVTVWVFVPVEIVDVVEIVVLKPAHAQGHSSTDATCCNLLQSTMSQKKRSAQVVLVDADVVGDVFVSEDAEVDVEDAEVDVEDSEVDVGVDVDGHSHGQTSIDMLHKAR